MTDTTKRSRLCVRIAVHCLDGIDDQVEDHLLDLNAVGADERQILSEIDLHEDAISPCLGFYQGNRLGNNPVDVDRLFPW